MTTFRKKFFSRIIVTVSGARNESVLYLLNYYFAKLYVLLQLNAIKWLKSSFGQILELVVINCFK